MHTTSVSGLGDADMNKQTKVQEDNAVDVPAKEQSVCGIVMPISAMDDYDADH
jgi:hypothetical protein